jgi:hypothetical protein
MSVLVVSNPQSPPAASTRVAPSQPPSRTRAAG